MNLQGTSNPVLNDKAFRNAAASYASTEVMTIKGTMNKVLIMFGILLLSAGMVWANFFNSLAQTGDIAIASSGVFGYVIVGAIGGFILALVTIFKMSWANYTAPIYALLEGLFVGGISAFFEAQFPGIVIQAALLTMAVFGVMLFLYRSQIIKVTAGFRKGVIAATFGIMIVYFLTWILGMFGIQFGYIHDSGPLGIGLSLVIVGIAALNLVLDFDFIEKQAAIGAPKNMEWFGAFGLVVTLVWLYIEILRLLSKLRD